MAVLPVLGTAYTCQMTIHHIMRDLKPFTERRVTVMSVRVATWEGSQLHVMRHGCMSRPPSVLSCAQP